MSLRNRFGVELVEFLRGAASAVVGDAIYHGGKGGEVSATGKVTLGRAAGASLRGRFDAWSQKDEAAHLQANVLLAKLSARDADVLDQRFKSLTPHERSRVRSIIQELDDAEQRKDMLESIAHSSDQDWRDKLESIGAFDPSPMDRTLRQVRHLGQFVGDQRKKFAKADAEAAEILRNLGW